MIEVCAPLAEDIITVTPNSDRALPAETLAQNLETIVKMYQ